MGVENRNPVTSYHFRQCRTRVYCCECGSSLIWKDRFVKLSFNGVSEFLWFVGAYRKCFVFESQVTVIRNANQYYLFADSYFLPLMSIRHCLFVYANANELTDSNAELSICIETE